MDLDIAVEYPQTESPVAIVRVAGRLDALSYGPLTAQTDALIIAGTRYVLLDLSEVSFLSSAGVTALRAVISQLEGEQPTEFQQQWQAFYEADQQTPWLRLLKPSASVRRVLQILGFDQLVAIHDDEAEALAAFG